MSRKSCLPSHTPPCPRHAPQLLTSYPLLEQVPTEVDHVSYLTGQIAHDLRIMYKFYTHYMPSWSGLLNKLPNIHALVAELKVA